MTVALEAVLVLDARLDEVVVLNNHQRPDYAMGVNEKRMVLSQTARVTARHAASASPEEANHELALNETSMIQGSASSWTPPGLDPAMP